MIAILYNGDDWNNGRMCLRTKVGYMLLL
jgi:hypothetical protein